MTEHSDEIQPLVIRWAEHPEVEARLKALDRLDAAYDLVKPLDGVAADHIHVAREDVMRAAGQAMFRIQRTAQSGKTVEP